MGNSFSSSPASPTSRNSYETGRTRSSPSASMDISHLTDKERAQIQSVFTRQMSFERKEQARIEALKKEMIEFERSVLAASNSSSPSMSDGLCAICRTAPLLDDASDFAMGGSGQRCDSCGRVCCPSCGEERRSKTTQNELWVCFLCERRYQFIMKSGLWFGLKESCPTVADFGLQLHDKPDSSGAVDSGSQMITLSPERVPSIMLTRPSVKDKKSGPSLATLNDSDEAGITAPASSDSDECGGFTPPPQLGLQSRDAMSPKDAQSSQQVDEVSRDEFTGKNSANGNFDLVRSPVAHSQSLPHRSPGKVKDDERSEKPWSLPSLLARKKKGVMLSESVKTNQNVCIETNSRFDKENGGDELDDDKPLSPTTWDRVRNRAKTKAEKDIRKKLENRWSLNESSSEAWKHSHPYSPTPKNAKPWTSAASAMAARRKQKVLCKSVVEQMQPGERPYQIHLADLNVPVDKGVDLSDEKVSKMLESSDSLYAVGGYQVNGKQEQGVRDTAKETPTTEDASRSRASSGGSCGAHSCISEDPNYARIGPLLDLVHSQTPIAKEAEPGYAVVDNRVNNHFISSSVTMELESPLNHTNDETGSLGEVSDHTFIRGGIAEKQRVSTGDDDHDDDNVSIGEVNEPGYARVKILTLEDAGDETEMVIVVDNDSDHETVGYSRVDKKDDIEDDVPDPGYQRIADVRRQTTALLTQGEVDALYAKVNRASKTKRENVDDPSALYSRVMKVKVRDSSGLYSKINRQRAVSPLYSKVHKLQAKETESDNGEEGGSNEVTVDDVTALYARVVKRKDKKESTKTDDRSKERKPRRRLPRLPSDDEHISLLERTKRLEKKLLRLSRGLGDDDDDETESKLEKSRASPKDIPQSSQGLVKQRMAFFSQQSNAASDSDDVVRRKRGRAQMSANSSASVSSSVESYASDSVVCSRSFMFSPTRCISPTGLSSRQSVGEEVVTSPGPAYTESRYMQVRDGQTPQGLQERSIEKTSSISPLLSPDIDMQRTWPRPKKDKGKPPVSPNFCEETVRVMLHKEVAGIDDASFGLSFEVKPRAHRLHISRIAVGSVASQCSKIGIGDELLAVDGKPFSSGEISLLMDYMNKVDDVKLRLRKRPRQGVAFKEKVKEQQRLRLQDKFSLAESYRLSGSEMSLNSSFDSIGEGQHVEGQNVEQCKRSIVESHPDHVKKGNKLHCIENCGNLLRADEANRGISGSREDLTYSSVHGTDNHSSVVLRDMGKKAKKKGIWKRFSSALTKNYRSGSIDDLTRLSDTFVVLKAQRRIGSVDNVEQEDQHPHTAVDRLSELDQLVTAESRTTVSSENSHESGSTVPSVTSPLPRSCSGDASTEPSFPLQLGDYKLGQGQVLDQRHSGKMLIAMGEIELSVMYHGSRMTVEIIKALNLQGQNKQNAQIPYVKVYLVSSVTHQRLAKRKTKKAATRPVDPAFYEQLYFSESDFRNKHLQVMVWRQEGSGVFAKNRCIGTAILSLDELDLSSKVQDMYSLFALPHQKSDIVAVSPTNRTL